MDRVERDKKLDQILAGIIRVRGVTAAAMVDGDGFVTHIRRDFEINTDALGVGVQIALGAALQTSQKVLSAVCNIVLIESKDGLILLAPLVRGFVLAVTTDDSAMMGAVRFEMKETIVDINRMFTV